MRARLTLAILLLFAALSAGIASPSVKGAPLAQGGDPASGGPFAITRTSYDSANQELFVPTGWTRGTEVRARVTYPTSLGSGPFPLVMLLHGRHVTCFDGVGNVSLTWPCPGGTTVIGNHLGYEYVSDVLASHGMIVVSISANGINARDGTQSSDGGSLARAELIMLHLQLWQSWNTTTTGTFGSLFTGRVSLNQVGLMGHSRGGEGIVRAYLLNASSGSPFGIRALFPLAPVDFNRPLANNVPMAVMLPYCDGDVSDLQGVHFFDDVRYNLNGDTAPKHTILVMGANHNFFNTNWTPGSVPGGADDWLTKEDLIPGTATDAFCNPNVGGNGRLSSGTQRATGLAYMAAFFRLYLKNETAFGPFLQGTSSPPGSAGTTNIHVSYHPPFTATGRHDINRFLSTSNLATNTLGGAASASNVVQYALCGGESPQPIFCLSSSTTNSHDREPHASPNTATSTRRGPGQLDVQWTQTSANYRNALPTGSRDLRSYTYLQIRASTVWGNSANPAGTPQDFRIILTDGANRTSTAKVSDHSQALFSPPGGLTPVTPKTVLNMVRIPLFAFGGIDPSDVRTIDFRFDQRGTGWLLITDLMLTNSVPAPPPSVSGVSPGAGQRGATVTITGNHLAGATAVRFNGVSAAFTVTSNSTISATVPNSATSGIVTVETPGGTANTSGAFTVLIPSGNVGVQVGDLPGPSLSARFTARTTCGPILNIQFGNPGQPFDNAVVSISSPGGGPQGQRSGFTYTPPGGTTTVEITLQRASGGGSATVNPVRFTDGCGTWNTFVGGGPNAFN
jgi:hypothetical protein